MYTDTIADMLTRVRNGCMARHSNVRVRDSKMNRAILDVLQKEGYIYGYSEESVEGKKDCIVRLKYYSGAPVISRLDRISSPGCRVYKKSSDLKIRKPGLFVVSTSRGVISNFEAMSAAVGGEVICYVF